MFIPKALVFITLAAFARAFKIPEGTEDGVYAVYTRSDGVEVIAPFDEAVDIIKERVSSAPTSPNPAILKGRGFNIASRWAGQIWCGCGFTMDHGNCDAAVDDLKNQLNNGVIPAHMSYFAIKRSPGKNVVAFACSRNDLGLELDGDTYGQALERITSACGLYIAGAYDIFPFGQPLIVGYARYQEGDDFCGGSTSSPANHC
jgi:hypothetical protein